VVLKTGTRRCLLVRGRDRQNPYTDDSDESAHYQNPPFPSKHVLSPSATSRESLSTVGTTVASALYVLCDATFHEPGITPCPLTPEWSRDLSR
jgi:hypothetical protein